MTPKCPIPPKETFNYDDEFQSHMVLWVGWLISGACVAFACSSVNSDILILCSPSLLI